MKAVYIGILAAGAYCGAMGAYLYHRKHTPVAPARSPLSTIVVAPDVHVGATQLTAPGRRYSLMVFTDYQCPACKELEGVLATLEPDLRDSLTILVRHNPLTSIHAEAKAAHPSVHRRESP